VKDNFERCLAEVLKHEGGWADHPKDPGGATMKGVTIGTYAQFKGRKVTKDELRAISDADLRAIYRRKYWDLVRGDDLPAGLDLVAFDGAVNSGPSRGARWLQTALGVPVDGKIGPATIDAANRAHQGATIIQACAARMTFLRGLRTWETFGKGWSRRVDGVERVALEMARGHVSKTAKNEHDAGDVLTQRHASATKPPRTSPAQSTTVQASALQMVSGAGAGVAALGALDGTAQIVALVFAGVVILAAAWIMRERIRKWASGDR
jgi:lysozyme family protein